jgi:acetyl-CoA acetyltransferase
MYSDKNTANSFSFLKGLAPIKAIRDALQKANWTIESVDLFELNEAFAAQSVAVIRELRINPEKVFSIIFVSRSLISQYLFRSM